MPAAEIASGGRVASAGVYNGKTKRKHVKSSSVIAIVMLGSVSHQLQPLTSLSMAEKKWVGVGTKSVAFLQSNLIFYPPILTDLSVTVNTNSFSLRC